MKKLLLVWGLLTLLASATASAAGFDDRYTARTGDINGDGRTDIYLRHQPKIAMIPLDDLDVPIPLPADVGEFVLQQNASGDFDLVSNLTQSMKDAVKQWAIQQAIEIVLKDFNVDGIMDVLVRGVSGAISGAHNTFVFGPSTPRAPPAVAKSVNATINQFISDVGGFSDNPNYFMSGVTVSCYIVYINTLHYDPYSNEYYYSYDPYLVCYYTFDPAGFSVPAIEFLNSYVPMANSGEVIAQSPEATTVSDMLEEIFGIPFFRNGFELPGVPEPSECQHLTAPDAIECAKTDRLARVTDFLRDLARRATDSLKCSTGEHHYFLSPGAGAIPQCALGSPFPGTFCSTWNVYHEQLTHPVMGYLTNHKPIRNLQVGVAQLGIPGPFDNGGPIIFYVRHGDLWHENHTLPGHIFHEGWVRRQTVHVPTDGNVYITTEGGGNGACPTFNEVVGISVFMTVDKLIKLHLINGVTAQHEPVPP